MTQITPNPEDEKTSNYYSGGTPSQNNPPQPFNSPYPPQQFNTQNQPVMPGYFVQAPVLVQAVPMKTNGSAVGSFITALITFMSMWFLWLIPLVGVIAAGLAVFFGHKALKDISVSNENGRGLAIAGLTLGYLSLIPSIFWCMAFLMAAANSATS